MAKPKGSAPSSAPAPAPRESLLTTAQAAILLEIGPERVRQLVKSGHIEKRGKDQVPLVSAVRGYISFLKDEARRSSKSASASRVQDARAREIELKTAEREGRLMDVEEVREIVADWGGTLRTGLSSIPARLSRDMAFRRKIETEIDDVLRQATERFEQAMGNRPLAGGAAQADTGDDS